MNDYTVLEWLYKQLKQKRIALGNAESKPNVSSGEIEDIKRAIDTIECIIAIVIERDDNTPADVVEVVRCKDCKYWQHEYDVDFVCNYHYGYRTSMDFCSYGERREK